MITDMYISDMAKGIFTNVQNADAGRASYLRTLIEATRDELGDKGEPQKAQLAALAKVHERFYAIILAAAQPFVPKTLKQRSVELHRRANFARTAMGAVRGHIRAGNDVAALNPARITKGQLAKPPTKDRPATLKGLHTRVNAQGEALVQTLRAMAGTDKDAAVQDIQQLLGVLTSQLVALGVASTTDSSQAIDEHRPLKIGKRLFVPTENNGTAIH